MREIRSSIFIEAAPEKVWKAVESQEMIRKCLGGKVEFDPRLGGQVRLYGVDDQGQIIRMGGEVVSWEPFQLLQFTWAGIEPHKYEATLLTLTLEPHDRGTKVTLVHSNFESEQLFLSFSQGWKDPHKTLEKIAEIALSA